MAREAQCDSFESEALEKPELGEEINHVSPSSPPLSVRLCLQLNSKF